MIKRVVVRVHQVLQDIFIGVCVVVCEIPPHCTLQGGIELCGQRTCNVTVLSGKKCNASFFEKLLEKFLEEFFTFVGFTWETAPLSCL